MSLQASFQNNDDKFSAANKIGPEWVDSTSYRENFTYEKIIVSPRFHASWKKERFSVNAGITPEYFTDRLTSNCRDEHFDAGNLFLFYDFKFDFKPAEGHTLWLSGDRRIKHPEYLQLCWFPRAKNYATELESGNPNLLPVKTYEAKLGYEFERKSGSSKFSSMLELGEKVEKDRVEKTFNNEMIDGREYRVLTWVNAGWSNTFFGEL